MAQWVKCLVHKHKDLAQTLDAVMNVCNSSAPKRGWELGTGEFLGSWGLTSLMHTAEEQQKDTASKQGGR